MIKHLMTVAFAFLAIGNVYAQEFEHAQTRIQEGVHEFFIRPIVAELDILNGSKIKEYPVYSFYKGISLDAITNDMLENAKANAAYKAALEDGADIILGATFYVTNNKKDKGLDVIVRGYPAKYIKFHKYGEDQNDSKWIDPLLDGQRNRSLRPTTESIRAVRTDTKK